MDKRLTLSAKIVLIVWPKIPQMPHKISAQFVCPSPKVSNFWRRNSLWMSVVREKNPPKQGTLYFSDYILYSINYWIDIYQWKSSLLSTEGHCRLRILLYSLLSCFVVLYVRSIFKFIHHILSLCLHIFRKTTCSAED